MTRKRAEGLSVRELRFCNEYLIDQNGTQAAIRAGYSARSARQIGSVLLNREIVWNKVKSLQDAALKRVQASVDQIIAEWTNLGFSDPGNLVWRTGELDSAGAATEPGTIKPLFEMPPEVRRTIKSIKFDINGRPEFSFWPKDASLTSLGRNKKLLTDNVNVNITLGFSERLRAAREKRLGGGK